MPPRCDSCGLRWRTLFDVFVNGLGWKRHCGGCADPVDHGGPRPYLGTYPITAYRKPAPRLAAVQSSPSPLTLSLSKGER